MKKWGMALAALGFFWMFAMLLLTVLVSCGTNVGLYRELQEANGLPEAAGVSQEEMENLDGMLAGMILAGDETALDDSPFNERELTHMRDVLALFDLARTVRNVLLVAAVVLLAAGLWLSRGVHLTCISLIGLAALLLPLGAFAVWAAVDFSSAFTFFHETLFTNDLWLLNPETDLLLRLLPEQFFADIAATIAARPGDGGGAAGHLRCEIRGGNLYERPRGSAARCA